MLDPSFSLTFVDSNTNFLLLSVLQMWPCSSPPVSNWSHIKKAILVPKPFLKLIFLSSLDILLDLWIKFVFTKGNRGPQNAQLTTLVKTKKQ